VGCRHRLRTLRRRGRVKSPRFFHTDGISRSRTSFVRALPFIYYKTLLITIYLSTQASTGARRKTPQFPDHHPRLAPFSAPHRALRSQPGRRHPIDSNLLCPRQIMARRRSRKLQHQVFSTHTGVLARTLVGHESGVWGVCLVGKGGWREGGEGVKRLVGVIRANGGTKERKKQKQRERQP
jgi:hypothetical protein